jgi:hypothetical protein
MKLAEFRRRQSEFSPHQPPVLDQPFALEMAHIVRDPFTECNVADARLEIAPYVVDIHTIAPMTFGRA